MSSKPAVLVDSCVPKQCVDGLRAADFDVIWVLEWDRDPGDTAIMSAAHQQRRVVVTLDKDFGHKAVFLETPHAGIIRLVDVPVGEQAQLTAAVIVAHAQELVAGAIITAERNKIRLRPGSSQ